MRIITKCLLSIFLLSASFSLFSQEKLEQDPQDFRFFAGFGIGTQIGPFKEIGDANDWSLFAGIGYLNFDLYTELMITDLSRDEQATSVYGDIDYKQDLTEVMLALHLRYYIFRNHSLAPFIGGFIGGSALNQSDDILGNSNDPEYQESIFYGPSVGIVIFPGKLFNIFLEARYYKYNHTFSPYNLESKGQTGEWEKTKGSEINPDSFYIGGGASCTIF